MRELARLARLEVVTERRERVGEGGEAEEHLGVVRFAGQGRNGAQRGERDGRDLAPVEAVDVEAAARVLEPRRHDLLVHDADGFEPLLALREHGHRLASALRHVHGHQAPERRALVRHEEEAPVGIAHVRVGVGEALEEEGRLAVAIAVRDPDLALVARALVARDDQVPSVEGQVRAQMTSFCAGLSKMSASLSCDSPSRWR